MGNDMATGARATQRADAVAAALSLRADARENRERILLAAREIFADQGPDAPLEEIARRAGVGIATLYRRFPDRQMLLRGVALDIWHHAAREAHQALAEEPDAFQALARYMHRALDLRAGAVMPLLVGDISLEDDDLRFARDQSSEPLQRIVDVAQAEGTLRPDVAFGDIGLLIIRLSRPYVSPFPCELDDHLAHRQLDLLLDGLRHDPARSATSLSGPAMTLADLTALVPGPTEGATS